MKLCVNHMIGIDKKHSIYYTVDIFCKIIKFEWRKRYESL